MALSEKGGNKRKRKRKEKEQGRGILRKMELVSCSIKMAPAGKEEKNRMVLAGLGKAEGEQEDGAHQPPSPESIPAGPCPLDQCFKMKK